MLKQQGMDNLLSESYMRMPSINSILKISLGLIFVAILSSTLVYAETTSVNVEGNTFDIEYTGDGVSVSGVEPDLDFISLIFTVDVTNSPGVLEITFERSFFDSVYQGSDDDFIVLADGDEPSYTETDTNSQFRTLSITLPSGTDEVEIIGSVFGQPTPEPTPEPTPVPPTPEPTPVPPTPTPTPKEDDKVDDKPKTECGQGTILKDGVCMLDERCGAGTVLKDGVCVVESVPVTTTPKGLGKELIYGFIAAFVVAGIIGIILALMGKVGKSS
jgi:hypothetical protein